MSAPNVRSFPGSVNPLVAGIRSLDGLRLRCRIDDDGCWLWAGAVQRFDGQRAPESRVWMADMRRSMNGKRAAALLAGKRIPAGRIAYGTCLKPLCVNPRCVRIGTSAERGAFLAGLWVNRGSPQRIAACTQSARLRSRLTPELARWVRESPQTGRDIARALELPESVVSRIRRGETWREAAPAASVFALGCREAA